MKIQHSLKAEVFGTKVSIAELENLLKNAKGLGFTGEDFVHVDYYKSDPHDQRESDYMHLVVQKNPRT